MKKCKEIGCDNQVENGSIFCQQCESNHYNFGSTKLHQIESKLKEFGFIKQADIIRKIAGGYSSDAPHCMSCGQDVDDWDELNCPKCLKDSKKANIINRRIRRSSGDPIRFSADDSPHDLAQKLAQKIVGDLAALGFVSSMLENFRRVFSNLDDEKKKNVIKELKTRNLLHPNQAKKHRMTGSDVYDSVVAMAKQHMENHNSNRLRPDMGKFSDSDKFKELTQ